MKHRNSDGRISGVEILAAAGLVLALAVLGAAGVGFELQEFFSSVSVPQ